MVETIKSGGYMVGDENSLSDKDKLVTNENVETQQPPKVELTSPDKIKETLDRIYDKFYLIVHQTRSDLAQSIVEGGGYFDRPLHGTALMVTPDNIMSLLPELDSDTPAFGTTHKGSKAAVIMAFPRSIIDLSLAVQKFPKNLGTDSIDSALADLYSSGNLDMIGIPNNLIAGYYTGGKFNLNQNVNFEIPAAWRDVEYVDDEDSSPDDNKQTSVEEDVLESDTSSNTDLNSGPPTIMVP